MKKLFLNLLFVSLFMIPIISIAQTTKEKWTKKEAVKWFKGGSWRHGMKLNMNSSVNLVEFAQQYHKNEKVWNEVFNFLSQKNLDSLPAGNYSIDGEKAFAFVQEYITKDFSDTKWESHRKYIDLQCVLEGEEKIGIALVKNAKVIKPYDDSTDVANYEVSGRFHVAHPNKIFLFFPQEAHRPCIKTNRNERVRKLVIKIEVVN